VYHAGQVAGVLELRFARANSFREADLRSAELMAGLLSEAMVTAARMKWKEALASERQSMLEALERIKPQLERLGSDSPESVSAQKPPIAFSPQATAHSESFLRRMADTCPACGSEFFDESESFCGICGTARPVEAVTADSEGSSAAIKTDLPWLTPYEQEGPSNGHSSVILREGVSAWFLRRLFCPNRSWRPQRQRASWNQVPPRNSKQKPHQPGIFNNSRLPTLLQTC
jgi:hypothetical protein